MIKIRPSKKQFNILVINPGSTSTKIAVYNNDDCVFVKALGHTADELKQFEHITDQYEFRKELILKELKANGLEFDFDAVIGRGGLAKPVEGGVYIVNEQMKEDMRNAEHQHACDLGCILAHDIAAIKGQCPSYVADPGTVDELCDYARISGSPLMNRICIWHALNQRAVARRFAKKTGRQYEDMNLIICHLGGGISIAAHDHGRAIDANNALDGEGPFSPERAGSLPAADLIRLCYSGKYTEEQLLKRIAGHAGLTAHLGTNDVREIEQRMRHGDKKAKLILDAMIYHVAKGIASEGAVLYGKVDAILLTGGMAHSKYIIEKLTGRIDFLAPVHVFPGEDEMLALAQNALGVLRGELTAKDY